MIYHGQSFSFFTLSAAAELNFFTSTQIYYTLYLHYSKTDFRFLQATKTTENRIQSLGAATVIRSMCRATRNKKRRRSECDLWIERFYCAVEKIPFYYRIAEKILYYKTMLIAFWQKTLDGLWKNTKNIIQMYFC